jgi:hypothetical protein
MDWKKLSVNAVSALFVAVVSGLLVWWLTRAPPQQEGLVYRTSPPVSFATGQITYTFTTVRVLNMGDAPARQVLILITHPHMAKLEGYRITTSRSRPSTHVNVRPSEAVQVSAPALLPSEQINVSVLYTSKASFKPELVIKSANALARPYEPPESNIWIQRLQLFVALLIVAVAPLIAGSIVRRNMGILLDLWPSKNDAGFMMLHAGLADEARSILAEAVKTGIHGSLAFSNYGAALAILGEHARAEALIATAWGWARTPNQRGTVLLNRSIAEFCSGDVGAALDSMKQAKRTSKMVELYFHKSKLCEHLFKDHPEFRNIFAEK